MCHLWPDQPEAVCANTGQTNSNCWSKLPHHISSAGQRNSLSQHRATRWQGQHAASSEYSLPSACVAEDRSWCDCGIQVNTTTDRAPRCLTCVCTAHLQDPSPAWVKAATSGWLCRAMAVLHCVEAPACGCCLCGTPHTPLPQHRGLRLVQSVRGMGSIATSSTKAHNSNSNSDGLNPE